MNILRPLYLILILLAWQGNVHADLIVVVNQNNPVEALSSRQITDIYMGRFNSYPNGHIANTTDHPQDSQIKVEFYSRLVGKSIAQINAYWARLLFTGKAEPPTTKLSGPEIVAFVQNNKNAIAYLDDATVIGNLKVVYRFENIE